MIDHQGKEIWKHQFGGKFSYPKHWSPKSLKHWKKFLTKEGNKDEKIIYSKTGIPNISTIMFNELKSSQMSICTIIISQQTIRHSASNQCRNNIRTKDIC